MSVVKKSVQAADDLRNPALQRWPVMLIYQDSSIFVFHYPNMPEQYLPGYGEVYPVLKNIPNSITRTSYLAAPRPSNVHEIVCFNPENIWGQIVFRTRLLRKAGLRIYTIDRNGWGDPVSKLGGYVDSFVLESNEISLTVFS